MAEVMIDPVRLPGSGQIMDRRHIVSESLYRLGGSSFLC